MRFLDTVKTKLFGEKDGTHGFRVGFVPFIVGPLPIAGAVVMGAPVAGVVAAGVFGTLAGCGLATAAACAVTKEQGYSFGRYIAGVGAAGALGAALAFSVSANHLPPKQPKAPVAGPVPSTLEIKPSGGGLCKNFNVAETTDAQERTVFILTVPKGCTVPAAAAAVPR